MMTKEMRERQEEEKARVRRSRLCCESTPVLAFACAATLVRRGVSFLTTADNLIPPQSFARALIRVQLPDGHVIESAFAPLDTVRDVQAAVVRPEAPPQPHPRRHRLMHEAQPASVLAFFPAALEEAAAAVADSGSALSSLRHL